LAQGHRVCIIDNLSRGRIENLAHVRDHQDFDFHPVDIRKRAAILPLFANTDWAFHIAGPGDIFPSIERLLGWQAEVSFEDDVARALENIDYWRQAPLWIPESIGEATATWSHHLGTVNP